MQTPLDRMADFDLSDEPLSEPPRRFLWSDLPEPEAEMTRWVFRVGETRFF